MSRHTVDARMAVDPAVRAERDRQRRINAEFIAKDKLRQKARRELERTPLDPYVLNRINKSLEAIKEMFGK